MTISSLTRSTHSVLNRLSSIEHDSLFVQQVAAHYKLPVIANERCGSWYVPPELKGGSAYFKSTDGHQGQWRFSARRLNLQVLDIVGQTGGRPRCILVDSTRRGKSMPDALSKTVPIWCAVMNRLLFDGESGFCTPESVVGRSEHSQIEARLDRFVSEAKRLQLNLPFLRQKISLPLQPIWITPSAPLPSLSTQSTSYPIICLTASHLLSNPSDPSTTYIQGAADDSEFWQRGLTSSFFWQHRSTLLSSTEDELPDLIQSLLNSPKPSPNFHSATPAVFRNSNLDSSTTLIKPTQNIYIASLASVGFQPEDYWDAIIACAPTDPFPESSKNDISNGNDNKPLQTRILHLPCPEGKLGSRYLRSMLHAIPPFITSIVQQSYPHLVQADEHTHPRILFTCPTGTDFAAGAALVALCVCVDEKGRLVMAEEDDGEALGRDEWEAQGRVRGDVIARENSRNGQVAQVAKNGIEAGKGVGRGSVSAWRNTGVDKTFVRQRLAWITQSKSDVNPSRETLKAVNIYLMGRGREHVRRDVK
ncbi:MAG: hypothetical protein Q9170_006751 [Blastenia crenularia]